MSGTPSKMLEHLLDTRLNVQVGPNDDPFLDDFLLTHIVFMPIAQLVDELASHYHNDSEIRNGAESPEDYEYMLTCKKRVVHFIQRWVMAVRHAVFEDSAAAHFIEVRSVTETLIAFAFFSRGKSYVHNAHAATVRESDKSGYEKAITCFHRTLSSLFAVFPSISIPTPSLPHLSLHTSL